MSNHDLAVGTRQLADLPLSPTPPEPEAAADAVAKPGEEIAMHGAEVGLDYVAETLGAAGHAGGSVASAASEALGGLGWALMVAEAWEAMLSAPSEGRVEGVLDAAFGTGPSDSNVDDYHRTQTAYAVGAVLSGMDDDQIAELEQQWGSERFERGLEMARSLRDEHPADFAEAQETYRAVKHDWQDGVAAALEGWYDSSRDAVFKQAYAQVTTRLRAGDPGMHAARRAAHRSKEQGVLDAAHGQVDPERVEQDGSYRSGVSHAIRTLEEGGPDAVQREVDGIELRREHRQASGRVPVQG